MLSFLYLWENFQLTCHSPTYSQYNFSTSQFFICPEELILFYTDLNDWETVLPNVVYCCNNKLPQTEHHKTTQIYYFTVLEIEYLTWIEFWQDWIKGSVAMHYFLEALEEGPISSLFTYWWNPVLCDWRTKYLFLCWLPAADYPHSLQTSLHSSYKVPINQSKQWCQIFFHAPTCLTFFSSLELEKYFLVLRTHVIILGHFINPI